MDDKGVAVEGIGFSPLDIIKYALAMFSTFRVDCVEVNFLARTRAKRR